MAASVAVVAVLAYWDEQRESAAALDDFAQEQATLASSVANELATRIGADGTVRVGSPEGGGPVLPGAARLERPNSVSIFVAPPGSPLRASDGREIRFAPITEALQSGRSTLRLGRSEAAALGLPERTAMAGLARVNGGTSGTWGVAVVASAERERDRERWARARLVLAITLAAGLVVGFGGHALHRQRKELDLERELEVTELQRERDQRLARLSKAATMVTLASGIAHEISTPLGVISGRAEQLLERAEGDRARRAALTILEQAQRIKDVVRGFLDVARGGSPTLQHVAPRALAGAAVALVEHRFQEVGVRLSNSVPESLGAIPCDPTLLEQALVNLLLNACDACTRGGTVELSASPSEGGLSFTVTDDGEGIEQVNAARATEPFFTTKSRGKGTGLGLAIVTEIAKSHRGSFSIQPGSPRGTRASIRIPVEGGPP